MKELKKEIDIIFKKKIEKKEEDLFIMKYKVLAKKIKGLTESFIVDTKRLKELLLENRSKSYCKFYFLEENNFLNLGLSFSDNEDCPVLDKKDILYTLDDELFIECDYKHFTNLTNAFEIGIGNKLNQLTNVTTTLAISYDFNIVDAYTDTLALHFPVKHFKFNMIQFRDTDLNDIIIPYSTTKHDRISFCVHTLINNLDEKNVLAESEGYDLGNLRP